MLALLSLINLNNMETEKEELEEKDFSFKEKLKRIQYIKDNNIDNGIILKRKKINYKELDLTKRKNCKVCDEVKLIKSFLHKQDRRTGPYGKLTTDAHIKNICNSCLSKNYKLRKELNLINK